MSIYVLPCSSEVPMEMETTARYWRMRMQITPKNLDDTLGSISCSRMQQLYRRDCMRPNLAVAVMYPGAATLSCRPSCCRLTGCRCRLTPCRWTCEECGPPSSRTSPPRTPETPLAAAPAALPAAPPAADCEAVGADTPPAGGLVRNAYHPPLRTSPRREPETPPAAAPAADCETVVAGTPPAGRGRHVDDPSLPSTPPRVSEAPPAAPPAADCNDDVAVTPPAGRGRHEDDPPLPLSPPRVPAAPPTAPLWPTEKLSLGSHRKQDVGGMSAKPLGLHLACLLHFRSHRRRQCCRLGDDRRWVRKLATAVCGLQILFRDKAFTPIVDDRI